MHKIIIIIATAFDWGYVGLGLKPHFRKPLTPVCHKNTKKNYEKFSEPAFA